MGSTTAAASAAATLSAPHVFHMGQRSERLDRRAMHGEIRGRAAEAMRQHLGDAPAGVILMQGGGPWTVYSTDMEGIFRQESYFQHLFGVENDGFYGAVDLRSGKSLLFMPRLPPEHAVWMGAIDSPEFNRDKYGVDEVHYVDEMAAVLRAAEPPCLHTLAGTNTDSGRATAPAQFEGMDAFEVETACLHFVLTECRVHKTGMEIQALRYANEIASEGHVAMMRGCTAGMMEYQLEAAFLHHCYARGGCRHAPYTPICASGPNGAVLHYGHAGAPNNRQLEAGDMMVCDMGCEYYGYDSDITTSFPVGGKFSEDQRIVYGAVLSAFKSVIVALKPGVSWPDMHRLATRKLLEGLKAGGLLQGDVDDMMAKHVGALFFPCGLGHFIGGAQPDGSDPLANPAGGTVVSSRAATRDRGRNNKHAPTGHVFFQPS